MKRVMNLNQMASKAPASSAAAAPGMASGVTASGVAARAMTSGAVAVRAAAGWGSALLCALVAGGLASVAQAQNAPTASQKKPAATAAAPSGPAVYEKWCAPCHAAGPGHPGTQSLQMKYGGKTPAVLLDRTDLTADMVSVFVRQGILMMAPFRKTEISDAELKALSAYVAKNYKKP